MKASSITVLIFAVLLFAGVSSAQHVKVIDGTKLVPLSPVTPTSSFTTGPNISVFAGQTIRLRIAVTNDSGPVYVLIGTPPPASACDPANPFFSPIGGSLTVANVTPVGRDGEFEFRVATDKRWKGTCRILHVRLGDGTEHLGRIYFR